MRKSPSISRRQVLRGLGILGLAGSTAGCSDLPPPLSDESSNNTSDKPTVKEYYTGDRKEVIANQEYDIPPHVFFSTPEPDVIKVNIPENTPEIADDLTFELFVYDKFPIGNEVELTKLAERTVRLGLWNEELYSEEGDFIGDETADVASDITKNELFEYDPQTDVPINQQIRFRLRITNERTGESRFVRDEDLINFFPIEDKLYPLDTNNLPDRITETDASYIMTFWGNHSFPAPQLIEELPYSEEADRDYEKDFQYPEGKTRKVNQIEIPKEHLELVEYLHENETVESRLYTDLKYEVNISHLDYSYYNRDTYNVLDNPLLTQMAETIISSQSDYGVENHFGRLDKARRICQSNEYEPRSRGQTLGELSITLPEKYWLGQPENCVGHSWNLCWLLYHMGYTCGTIAMTSANHLGVGVPVPWDVIEDDFPWAYHEALTRDDIESYSPVKGLLSEEFVPDEWRIEDLGDHPWLYIEATGPSSIGVKRDPSTGDPIYASVEYVLQPENPQFETNLKFVE